MVNNMDVISKTMWKIGFVKQVDKGKLTTVKKLCELTLGALALRLH